ncbi:MAG: cyclic pyranopterin monophosphate synthase MoaC [Promethearchaeota archaeon]
MIDISQKNTISRIATASGKIFLKKESVERIKNQLVEKGDVETIMKTAGITAVKKTPELIPFCHPIPINNVAFSINFEGENVIKLTCTVKSHAKTGVEMEALTGVSIALLNIWDVIKKHEKDENGQYPSTFISDIKVEEKIKGHEQVS